MSSFSINGVDLFDPLNGKMEWIKEYFVKYIEAHPVSSLFDFLDAVRIRPNKTEHYIDLFQSLNSLSQNYIMKSLPECSLFGTLIFSQLPF